MINPRVAFLFTMYLIGRRVRGHYKNKNEDGMLKAAILNILVEKSYTISQIAQKVSTKLSAISEKIIEMEREGLIEKVKQEDGRELYVNLTPEGKQKIQETIKTMQQHCVEATYKLTDEEIKTLLPLLGKIAD